MPGIYIGHDNRPEIEKITVAVKGQKITDPQSSIRGHIEQAVGCSGQEG